MAALPEDLGAFSNFDHAIEGFNSQQAIRPASSFVVVASQERRDCDALRFARATGSDYVAFVSSRKKAAQPKQDLRGAGVDAAFVSRIRSPAGTDIGAVTPEEITFSILANIVQERKVGVAKGDRIHARHSMPSVAATVGGKSTAIDDALPGDDVENT